MIAVLDGCMSWSDAAGMIAVGGSSTLMVNSHNDLLLRRCSKVVNYLFIDGTTSTPFSCLLFCVAP